MGTPPPSASRQRGEGWGHLRPQFQGPHGQRRPQLRWGLEEVPRQPEDTVGEALHSPVRGPLTLIFAYTGTLGLGVPPPCY